MEKSNARPKADRGTLYRNLERDERRQAIRIAASRLEWRRVVHRPPREGRWPRGYRRSDRRRVTALCRLPVRLEGRVQWLRRICPLFLEPGPGGRRTADRGQRCPRDRRRSHRPGDRLSRQSSSGGVSVRSRQQINETGGRYCERQRSNRASVRTFCQRGASPRRMEPYHVKPRVTASFNCRPGGVRARAVGDGVGSNRRRMRSP